MINKHLTAIDNLIREEKSERSKRNRQLRKLRSAILSREWERELKDEFGSNFTLNNLFLAKYGKYLETIISEPSWLYKKIHKKHSWTGSSFKVPNLASKTFQPPDEGVDKGNITKKA